ncbi:LacI family DNA-binding transcriptional regulator [Agreia sp.]|uniref:LacI family DNA-binding transcriptional regulator n=1 Tax=Agreia sp. TaxID=1872416 RepID=UPI0035BC21E7
MVRDDSEIGTAAVARLAGVSAATVSNTLNRPEKVLPATRQKVHDAIKLLDFTPNRAAAALRQGTSRLLGLVVPDIENPFYAAVASGVAQEAALHGYTMALYVTNDDASVELECFARLAELRAAGALVVPRAAHRDRLRRLESVGTRLVFIDRTEDSYACSVVIDDVTGGRLAVDHLLERHGRRIALVNGPHRIPQCRARRRGADLAFDRAQQHPSTLTEFTVANMTIDEGYAVGLVLAERELPDGVFCTNDQLAVGVVRGLRDAGVAVPYDVGVVGYGDLSLATEGAVQLTTVRQPKYELGRAAVGLILSEIAVKTAAHEHTQIMFEPDLVVRDSTRDSAALDAQVRNVENSEPAR